jgi:hypothetical protein
MTTERPDTFQRGDLMTDEQRLISILQNQRNQVLDALAMTEARLGAEQEKSAALQKQIDELPAKTKAK